RRDRSASGLVVQLLQVASGQRVRRHRADPAQHRVPAPARHASRPPVKAAAFEYHAPQTLDEALALLAEFGDEAKVLAGGQSLVPILALRLSRFEHLIDLNRIP